MKLLLVRPNHLYYQESMDLKVGLPLGLMYVAASIEKAGHEVTIFDSLASQYTEKWEESGATYYGVKDDVFKKIIEQTAPDLIGASTLFTAQIEGLSWLARISKKYFPSIPLVVGGPHVSAQGHEYLRQTPEVDYGCVGEGEEVIVDLIDCLLGKKERAHIPGLIWRKEVEVFSNERRPPIKEVDSIPLPAYHKVDMEFYFDLQQSGIKGRSLSGERNISMVTSRGCPYQCSFCSIHLHMGRRFRAHSPEYVIRHIEKVIGLYNVKNISFEDDTLTQDIKRFTRILEEISTRHLNFTWHTPNGVRADRMDKRIFQMMKRTGCESLIIGVESGSERVLNEIIHKSLDLKKVEMTAKLCREVGISLKAFFIVGLPGETMKEITSTLELAYKLAKKYYCYPSLGMFTPLIGTKLHDDALRKGYIREEVTSEMLSKGNNPSKGMIIISSKEFSGEQLNNEIEKLDSKIKKLKKIRSYYPKNLIRRISKRLMSKPMNSTNL